MFFFVKKKYFWFELKTYLETKQKKVILILVRRCSFCSVNLLRMKGQYYPNRINIIDKNEMENV